LELKDFDQGGIVFFTKTLLHSILTGMCCVSFIFE
jgi:hypothetical protein